jgi:hypothetical protein
MAATKISASQSERKSTPGKPLIPPELIDAITEHIADRYSTLTDNQRLLIALWIIHTYFYVDCAEPPDGVTPYLHIASLTPDAGKSAIAKILRDLCYKARIVYPTPSTLGQFGLTAYRTMIVDEIHHLLMQRSTDQAQLNAYCCLGNQPGNTISVSSKIPGMPDDRDPFFPKAWLGIGPGILEESLSTRSIRIIVPPGTEPDQTERERRQALRPISQVIADITSHLNGLAQDDSIRTAIRTGILSPKTRTLNDGERMFNRPAQLWRGLITIADLAGSEYGKRIRDFVADYIDREPAESVTLADRYDAALRALMRERRATVDNWARPGKAPLNGATNFAMTDADFGFPAPRNGIRGKLPSGSLILNVTEMSAELRFKATEFAEICAALPGSPSKQDVVRAYKDSKRLHPGQQTSFKSPLHSGQGDMYVIGINVTSWIWPGAIPQTPMERTLNRILAAETEDEIWKADE